MICSRRLVMDCFNISVRMQSSLDLRKGSGVVPCSATNLWQKSSLLLAEIPCSNLTSVPKMELARSTLRFFNWLDLPHLGNDHWHPFLRLLSGKGNAARISDRSKVEHNAFFLQPFVKVHEPPLDLQQGFAKCRNHHSESVEHLTVWQSF